MSKTKKKTAIKKAPTGEKKHAKYSASGSAWWLACAGAPAFTKDMPPLPDSPASKEGTTAHACLEMIMRHYKHPLAAMDMARKTYGAQMVVHAEIALKYIMRNKPKGADLLVEAESRLDFIEKGMYGTTDLAIVDLFDTLTIIDYKYGHRIVEPKDNSQLIYYALGIAHKYGFNFESVKLVIIQPRAEHPLGPIREHTMSMTELGSWEYIFANGVKACKEAEEKDPKKYLVPNGPGQDHCRYCPAAVDCPALSKRALEEAKADFSDDEFDLPSVQRISPQQLAATMNAIPKLETWIKAVRAYAFNHVKGGGKLKGWKLVEKRGTRKWLNPEKAELLAKKRFGDLALTEPKLLSPAQLEKIKGAKAFVGKHSGVVSSGVTLAHEKDKREAFDSIDADFTEVE